MVFIGAHISRDKTLIDTINRIIENGGNALQIFASNPRSSKITPLNEKFFGINPNDIKTLIKNQEFSLVIHNPYIINLSMPYIINKRSIDIKDCYWIKLILHELKIADLIGAIGCIIHCGKYTKNSKENGLEIMKTTLDFIIEEIKKQKLKSKIILETSTGQGTELLSNIQDFLDFYNSFNKDQKTYFKICIDTCHIWAAGYELKDVYELFKENKNLDDISVIHINNSKNPKNSHLDRHEEITKGYIDLKEILIFLKKISEKNNKITLILETPNESNIKKEFDLIK